MFQLTSPNQFLTVSLEEPEEISSMDELFIALVQRTINANLEDPFFDAEKLAKKVFLSRSQLNRRLSTELNCSSGLLIRKTRMQFAANLLEKRRNKNIGEIGFLVGYPNITSFCRTFKREFGCSPTEYRKQK